MTATATTRSHGPNPAQKIHITSAAQTDVVGICSAWRGAIEEAAARGYGISSSSSDVPVVSTGAVSDPTGSRASRPDLALDWLVRARRELTTLLHTTPQLATGGPFDPESLRNDLCHAIADIVELWPIHTQDMLNRLSRLAFEAAKNWPPKPKPGDVVDGVRVGRRTETVESCGECGGPIAGGAIDPLRRMDDKPYHMRPCYETARKRKQRTGVPPE